MQHKIAKQLFDIQESIFSIETYIGNVKDFYEYEKNKIIRRAVERELEIIGEALNNLKRTDSTIQISYFKQIISLRNQIIHSYDNIDNQTIWSIIIKHLPVLKTEIENLLNEK